jgi:hypothetical protein
VFSVSWELNCKHEMGKHDNVIYDANGLCIFSGEDLFQDPIIPASRRK